MTIAELIEYFRTDTGRMDLDDAGVLRFINEGQRYLDSIIVAPNSKARYFHKVLPGTTAFALTSGCRSINEVWLHDKVSKLNKLEKRSQEELRLIYPSLPDRQDKGRPLYYSPAIMRTHPDYMLVGELHSLTGFADVLSDKSNGFTGLVVYPVPDLPYIIEVWGTFFSPNLGGNIVETYWLTAHAALLLMAAKRAHATSLRNKEEVQDYDTSIAGYARAIDLDEAEEDAVDIGEMYG